MSSSCILNKPIAIWALTALMLILATGCAYVTGENLKTTSCRPETNLPTPSPLDVDYLIVYRVTDLPGPVLEALTPMADPGDPFYETDVVDPGLPMQRLTVGGYSKERAFVYYEQGGFVPIQCLVILDIADGKANVVFSTPARRGANNLQQLRAIVE